MTFEKNKSYHIWLMDADWTQKIHIVELIENEMIVYKFFGKRKRWWHYRVTHKRELEKYFEMGKEYKNNK